jgi:hypothetical protein
MRGLFRVDESCHFGEPSIGEKPRQTFDCSLSSHVSQVAAGVHRAAVLRPVPLLGSFVASAPNIPNESVFRPHTTRRFEGMHEAGEHCGDSSREPVRCTCTCTCTKARKVLAGCMTIKVQEPWAPESPRFSSPPRQLTCTTTSPSISHFPPCRQCLGLQRSSLAQRAQFSSFFGQSHNLAGR